MRVFSNSFLNLKYSIGNYLNEDYPMNVVMYHFPFIRVHMRVYSHRWDKQSHSRVRRNRHDPKIGTELCRRTL